MASYYSGQKVTREQAAQLLYQAGFRGDALWQMVAIAGRESGYDVGAHRTDSPRARLSGDRGLWQINYSSDAALKQAGIITQPSDLFNPATNARAAFYLYQQQGLQPWAMGAGGWSATGDPLKNTNQAAAQQAVQAAANQGLIGADWKQAGTSSRASATGAASGPMSLPNDARLVQNPNGLFAVFQVAPGLWVHYLVPRDGSVNINRPIESLTREQYKAKYGISVDGGLAEELEPILGGYGTYAKFWTTIIDQSFPPGHPARNDPGILRVLAQKAARPDMSNEELQNLIQGTSYWKSKTQGELQWNDLSPAERTARSNETASRMAQAFLQYAGGPINPGDSRILQHLEAVASGKMSFGEWTEKWLKPRAEAIPESPWNRQLREEREAQRQRPIDIENTVNQLRQTLQRWGLRWDEKTLATYGRALIEKTMSDDDVNKVIRQQAKVLYPWKDEATETIVAAAPWLEVYNRTMERQGSLETAEIGRALRAGTDPWTFEQQLKLNPKWRDTKNGRDEITSSVAELGNLIGMG